MKEPVETLVHLTLTQRRSFFIQKQEAAVDTIKCFSLHNYIRMINYIKMIDCNPEEIDIYAACHQS